MKTKTNPSYLAAAWRDFFAAAASIVLAASANAQWVFNPANGHEYQLTSGQYWGASDTSARSLPDWWDAEAEAVANGGHLATINDEAENSWVVDTFGLDALWIGLTDWGSEGSFYWISGEPVTYLNWDGGQPDNAHAGGEDTVHINHPLFQVIGYWNDLGAQGNSPYHPNPYRGIIERAAVNNPPVATDDFYDMNQASSLSVPSPGVMANDSDADGDTLTVELMTGPANAISFELNPDGSFSYTPPPFFYGEDTFTYRAHDGTAYSEIASVHITVAPTPACAAQIQPPINADGTSIFNVRRGVVPVKFRLTCDGNPTCDLPPATIAVTRTGGGVIGEINESVYSGVADSGSNFRVLECQYHYNLNSRALGVGTYRVDILIDGQIVGSATFQVE